MCVSHFVKSPRCRQYLCAFSVTLLTTTLYMHILWSSPTIPLLISRDSPIGTQLTKEQASWVASMKPIGTLPGALCLGVIIDIIGRKQTMLTASVFLFLSSIMIIFFESFSMLLIARFISGFGAAIASGVISIYIGEISDNKIRGRLLTTLSLGPAISAIVVQGIGPFISFIALNSILAAVPVLFCMAYPFLPESPYYLVKINRRQAAYDALRVLSKSPNVRLEEIETTVQHDEKCKLTLPKLLVQTNYRKAFIIVLGMKTLHQFSGLYAINAYLQTILKESQTPLSAETSSAALAVLQIPCVFLSGYFIDKLGRRPLLVMTATGCAIALIGEGTYFYLLQRQSVDLSNLYFLPFLFLTMYLVMVSVGIGNLVYVIVGELFTTNVKKVGSSVFVFYSGLLSFASVKMFNPISEAVGMYVLFWMFAGVCILGVFFAIFVLPETKGKSFQDIQKSLSGNRK